MQKTLTFMVEAGSTLSMMRYQVMAVGMQFLNWPDAASLRLQSNIVARLIADMEREQLRRASRR